MCDVITWKGPKALVNPNLGTQIAFWSARLKEFKEETLFKSLKSILKKKITNLISIPITKILYIMYNSP